MADEIKKNWVAIAGLILMVASLLTTGSIYVSSRPDREEVKRIVDEKVNYRLNSLEQKITALEMKIDQLIMEKQRK